MGSARMNRDLDIIEEYAHSGHHNPTMNSNAEGYIESNPAITAPGALAAAGYTDCHMKPTSMSFHILGEEVYDTVQQSPPAPRTPTKHASTPVEYIENHLLSVQDIDGSSSIFTVISPTVICDVSSTLSKFIKGLVEVVIAWTDN